MSLKQKFIAGALLISNMIPLVGAKGGNEGPAAQPQQPVARPAVQQMAAQQLLDEQLLAIQQILGAYPAFCYVLPNLPEELQPAARPAAQPQQPVARPAVQQMAAQQLLDEQLLAIQQILGAYPAFCYVLPDLPEELQPVVRPAAQQGVQPFIK